MAPGLNNCCTGCLDDGTWSEQLFPLETSLHHHHHHQHLHHQHHHYHQHHSHHHCNQHESVKDPALRSRMHTQKKRWTKQTDCRQFGRKSWKKSKRTGTRPWKTRSRTLHQHHSHHHRKIPHLDPAWIHKTLEKHGKTDRLSTVWQERLNNARKRWLLAMEGHIQDTSSASFSSSSKDPALRSLMDTQNFGETWENRQTVYCLAGSPEGCAQRVGPSHGRPDPGHFISIILSITERFGT